VAFQTDREFQDIWLSHLDAGQCSEGQPAEVNSNPNATCQGKDTRDGWWLKVFGYFGDQGDVGAYPGYTSQTVGTMVAYDVGLSPDTRAGVGIGYAQSIIDGKTFIAGTDIDTYEATAYIGHEDGPWYVDGSLSFGWNDYSGSRTIFFPGIDRTADAGYDGQDYTGFVTAGYHFSAQEVTITPLASLQYTHANLDGYGETGADEIDLNVQSQSYNFLETGLGVKVSHDFIYHEGVFVPDVHFEWLHDLDNPTLQDTAAFAAPGSPYFTTPGLETSDNTFKVGASFSFLSCDCSSRTWSLEGVYNYYWTDENYSAQEAMLRFTARF
jgi:outer membrane autotransporter protein